MGGIGIWQLLIVAVIIVLLFGTKKLRNLGSDLGSAVKGFKSAVTDESAKKDAESIDEDISTNNVVEQSKVADKEKDKV